MRDIFLKWIFTRKVFLLSLVLVLSFLLFGCDTNINTDTNNVSVNWVSMKISSNKKRTDKKDTWKLFSLDFTSKSYSSYYGYLESDGHKFIKESHQYSCSLDNCDISYLFDNNTGALESLSGDSFEFSKYRIFQKGIEDDIIFREVWADFEFITDTKFKTKDNNIIIKNPKKQLPIVLRVNKPHKINDNYVEENSVVAFSHIEMAPRFYDIKVSSEKTKLEDEYSFYYRWDRHNSKYGNILQEIRIKKLVGTDMTIVFDGYERKSRVNISVEFINEKDKKNIWKISKNWDWDNFVVKLSDLEKNIDYHIKLSFEEDGEFYNYVVGFNTVDDFRITYQKQSSVEKLLETEYTNEYTMCFSQYIDEEAIDNALSKTFGSGKFVTTNDVDYLEWYGYGYDVFNDYDNNWGWNCISFIYFADPKKEQKLSIDNIKSVYGETLSTEIKLMPHTIPESQKYVKLVGSQINVLPLKWENSKKTQLIYRNVSEWKIYYRACSFVKKNTDYITEKFNNQTKIWSYNNPNQILYNFLYCGKTNSKEFKFEHSEPWKEYVYDIDLENLFPENMPDIVELSDSFMDDDNNRGKIYLRTNIWLFAKYSNQKLYAWANSLNTGKPLKNVNYSVVYYDNVKEKLIQDEWTMDDNFVYTFPHEILFWLLHINDGETAGFVYFPQNNFYTPKSLWKNGSRYGNMFALDNYAIWGSAYRDQSNLYKIYAYTDRVLYKPGVDEDIFVSGWIRKPWKSIVQRWEGTIKFYDPNDTLLDTVKITQLDQFGGFKAKFSLWESSPLWSYRIESKFTNKNWEDLYFSSYIQVQEFKKSTIDITTKFLDNEQLLRIMPKYYFGQSLSKYDINLSYTLSPNTYGITDWDRCGEQRCDYSIYYNKIEKNSYSSGGRLSSDNFEWEYFDLDMNLPNKLISNLQLDITITDNKTKEVSTKSMSYKILPKYLVGIEWRNYDRHNFKESYYITGRVLEKKYNNKEELENYELLETSDNVTIEVYYNRFDNNQEIWPDGEYYYTNGWTYEKVDTLSSKVKWWIFSKEISFDKVGDYILRVIYDGEYENNQTIFIYDWDYWYYYGHIDNNYTLDIFVKDKEYDIGEEVEVNIDPYVKWASTILTIEKEWEILYQDEKILDGKSLSFKTKKEYYPNAHVSVAMIVGEQTNNKVSKRKEPRFMIGYQSVDFSPKMMGINFNVKLTDMSGNVAKYYSPGQRVKFKVKTTDYNGDALQTRLSVGIIDKALLDIYDKIRMPLKSFYTYSRPGFFVVANYQLLYKALKVFTDDGSKWWGWDDWDGLDPMAPRKNFMDLAFWRGGSITDEDWYIEFATTLPDNLTTRVIDIIWLGVDWEMETKREHFVVSKDVIMNVYLPRFISQHTTVRVPVSVIINKENMPEPKIIWNISVWNYKSKIELKTLDENDYYFDLNIDEIPLEDILGNDSIKVFMQVNQDDAVEHILPIRKENMFIDNFASFKWSTIDKNILLKNWAKAANIEVMVSTLPVAQLSNAVKYLLRYPYGCTEQLLSSLYPTLVAKDLANKGFLENWLVSGNFVNYHWSWKNIDNVLEDTLNRIYKNQNAYGLFGYWNSRSDGNMHLSIYVYHVLKYIQSLWYDVDQERLDKLNSALKNFSNIKTQLYYLLQKSLAWESVSLPQIDELLKKDNSRENKTMAYVIKVYQWWNTEKLYDSVVAWFKNNDYKNNGYYWSAYSDFNILKSYFTRALIKQNKLDEADIYVNQLLKQVNKKWYWGGSTQRNMQMIIAMKDFVVAKVFDNKVIEANLMFNWESKKILLWEQKEWWEKWAWKSYEIVKFSLENITEFGVKLDSTKDLYLTVKTEYIPQSLDWFESTGQNVKTFDLWDTTLQDLEDVNIWEIIQLTGHFEITEVANQLAVVYNIPAFTYIVNKISEDRGYDYWYYYDEEKETNALNFSTTQRTKNRYSCRPDHYEIRYDRLFLYYDDLPAGAGCEVTFSLMKTHDGAINLLYHNLFEMYGVDVWAQVFGR